jgi:hypothetical protein
VQGHCHHTPLHNHIRTLLCELWLTMKASYYLIRTV